MEKDEMIVDPENMRRLSKMLNIRIKLDTQLNEIGMILWEPMNLNLNLI